MIGDRKNMLTSFESALQYRSWEAQGDPPTKENEMTATEKQQRLQHLLSLESLTDEQTAEAGRIIDEECEDHEAELWEAEMRQMLWAENGGYSAGFPRPIR